MQTLHGGAQATRHLLDQGRRTIGVITGPVTWWEARERYKGWKETLVRAGLTPSRSLVVAGDWSAASGEQGMRQLLERQPNLDAVFACNDQMALGALGAIYSAGRRVPQDVGIVGFDNTPESAYFLPPLTTVHQHLVDVGRAAVQTLHQLVQAGRQSEKHIELKTTLLSPELAVRASSLASMDAF